jgi:tRNA(Ile)-lysidine synthase
MELSAQIELAIRDHKLLPVSGTVVVAVSGGVDSMVLLHVLHSLAERFHWRLVVAHFNHALRGRSSDADEKFVQRRAQKFGLEFARARWHEGKAASIRKHGLEMAARLARYEFLARTARQFHSKVVVTAHHADDQVELFFLRLFRGAGGGGLRGMAWRGALPGDSTIRLVRPLLETTKTELTHYARGHRVAFRADASNRSLQFDRNRIRRELLPLLERHYEPSISGIIRRTMDILGAESDCVAQLADRWLKSGKRSAFSRLPMAVQRQCVKLQLESLGITPNFDLVEQLRAKPGMRTNAAAGVIVSRERSGKVQVHRQLPVNFDFTRADLCLEGRAGEVSFAGVDIRWRLRSGQAGRRFPARAVNREFFDAGKVGVKITLRHWRPGDRFQPIGLPRPAKLQDLFTNAKINSADRRTHLVATTTKGIIFWVEGLRIGEVCKLTPRTKRSLKWHWRRT